MLKMDVKKKCIIEECWVKVRDMKGVRKDIEDGGKDRGSKIN